MSEDTAHLFWNQAYEIAQKLSEMNVLWDS